VSGVGLAHALAALMLLTAWPVSAQTMGEAPDDTAAAGPVADPALVFDRGDADTLRANVEIAEALLADAAREAIALLPPPPAVVVLIPATTEPAANLMINVATAQLQAARYTVHLETAAPGTEDPVYEFRYRVDELRLRYPDTGRRLGLWKTWVARDVTLAVQVTLVEAATGEILGSRRLVRGFQDRVPAGQLAAVESAAYPFTRATPQESGLAGKLEEIVVLGTLAGLIAIYFANTE
jgi:hypothetical protein